jgi:uncharacterized protein YndB with AHSA1/START domain
MVVVALVAAVIVILAVGATLPVEHVASASGVYARPPQEVWDAITGFERFPEWRTGIDRVEPRTFPDGASGWVEDGANGPIPLAIDAQEPLERLELRIASDQLPFGGTWTYELTPEGSGTRLRITEDGRVTNLLFRFMSRFVFGHTATMETYLTDLGAHFGEQTTPRVEGG